MTIEEALKQMREWDSVASREWADAIEAAMWEPVAEVVRFAESWGYEYPVLRLVVDAKMPPIGTKLFTFPPDAAGEIERLKADFEAACEDRANTYARLAGAQAEIERLRGLLFDVLATKQISPLPMWLRGEIKAALAGKETT